MPSFQLAFTGPDPTDSLRAAVESAAHELSRHLAGDTTLTVSVDLTDLPDHQMGWGSSGDVVRTPDGLWMPLAAWKLKTGQDPNGDSADILVKLDPAEISASHADPFLIALHEMGGHGLAFDGWSEGSPDQTPFSAQIHNGQFTGSAAEAINGSPVRMDGLHISDTPDLMNLDGPAQGYGLSILDLAMLSDSGVQLVERFGTLGNDALHAEPRGEEILAGYGSDTLSGHQGRDTLNGGPGTDSLQGGKGDDWLLGGAGADTLVGQVGDDTLDGGEGADLFLFRPSDGIDHVQHFEIQDRLQIPTPYMVSIDQASMETRISYEGGTVILDQTTSFDAAWVVG